MSISASNRLRRHQPGIRCGLFAAVGLVVAAAVAAPPDIAMPAASPPDTSETFETFEKYGDWHGPGYVDPLTSDEELERRAGRELSAPVREFLEAADTFAIFRMLSNAQADSATFPTRDLDLKTCGGRYSFRYPATEPVPLTSAEVARLKDLLLAKSACWVPPKDALDLKFSGFMVGYQFGISARRGDQEMFVLFNLPRLGSLQFRSQTECFDQGHPYRRTTELLCELLEVRMGRECVGDEW